MKKFVIVDALVAAIAFSLSACGGNAAAPAATSAPVEVARPSNPGGPGPALDLTGDAASGAQIFDSNCVVCHGALGKGGIQNAGSADGTVPPLNPIDATLKSSDYKTFATNLDLFIEHGSTPALADGATPPPAKVMPNWGDAGTLQPQQIADVIAYLISLNP